ncbi:MULTISPECIES: DUF1989 domain-containing protein [Nocardia]|uniref:DUF1989 domain-containing protein n=1 Tax=Nocardia TaxID=1817 RepID=UPI0007E98405|nr:MULTISPECIES: DUF1989 domain-containing protein [Nocardia]MBF6276192.1 DUF1989 domain-containing protein [Nocardia nova]OBA40924.1 urea carboxylase [Nocardia sp. 852002-51101_SCH5132738]OBB39235.1 urea carboxylase [Nocardia sp. 852002-51244_SCH5132740]OBF78017.1 urea carboxylase [Mycobacterium sp. 852002-51759_SCH5129042]
MSATASTVGARDHARAQAAAATVAGPDLPDGLDTTKVTFAQRVPGNGYTTAVLARGTRLRLADPDGAAGAHLLLLRAEAPWERLNVADTIKVPWQAYPGPGHPLLSDQGRVLATIVADTSGRHDTLCGPTPEVRRTLRVAGAKHGLTPRDIGPSVALFRGVRVGADGTLTATGSAGPGSSVELLIHLSLTVLIANGTHPLDDRPATPLDVVAWRGAGEPDGTEDTEPECRRAVQNTEQAWLAAHDPEAIA